MTDYLRRSEDALASILTYNTDILADRAEGLWIYDHDGNRFADFACGTAVTNLGHNHPQVIAAAHAQLDRVAHAGCVFRYESVIRLAEKLRDITPEGIEVLPTRAPKPSKLPSSWPNMSRGGRV